MTFAIITCAVFPSDQVERRLRIFIASAKWAMPNRQYPVIPYGVGTPWTIYRDIKLTKQLAHLKSDVMSPYDTVLYSDGSDAFFTGPIDEILNSYDAMDRPDIVVSASHQLGNVSNEHARYPGAFENIGKYRYPQVGGWIGKKDAMIAAFEKMEAQPERGSDDCFDFYDGWRDGWFQPTLDSGCEIFQVTDEDCVVGQLGRLQNRHTQSAPCVLHIAGGYHDPVHGKDYAIEPWAKKLGVI